MIERTSTAPLRCAPFCAERASASSFRASAIACGFWRAGCGAFDVTIGCSFGHVSSRWPVVCERFATDESVSTSHGSSSCSVFFFASTRT